MAIAWWRKGAEVARWASVAAGCEYPFAMPAEFFQKRNKADHDCIYEQAWAEWVGLAPKNYWYRFRKSIREKK